MVYKFYKSALSLLIILNVIMIAGCSTMTSSEQSEQNLRDLLDNHADVNEVRRIWSFRSIDPKINDMSAAATPILAAVVLGDIERVSELISNGASVKYVEGTTISPLECASFTGSCREVLKMTGLSNNNISYRGAFDLNVPLMKLLLENGADPDEENRNGISVRESFLCFPSAESSFIALGVFHDYSGEVGKESLVKCKEKIESTAKYLDNARSLKSSSMTVISLGGEEGINKRLVQARKNLLLLENIEEHGQKKAFSLWKNPDQYLAVAMERKQAAAAEQKRQREIAKRVEEKTRKLINNALDQDADLRASIANLKEASRPCKTLGDIYSQAYDFNCVVWVDGDNFSPDGCEDYQQKLIDAINQQSRQYCTLYRSQVKRLATLFNDNAEIAEKIIFEKISDARPEPDIKNYFGGELSRLKRIRDDAARLERASQERKFSQGMYDLMKRTEQRLRSKTIADQIIEKSTADTQRILYTMNNAQKMNQINADLKSINRQLASEVSTNEPSGSPASQSRCVAQSESSGPNQNVPERFCQYVFADYTGNVRFGLDDYSNEFMTESHSRESAKETLGFELLKKAKKECRAKGYSRVHHNETYEFNEVAVTVGQCKENNRMGSNFYLCGGSASFICARSD